MTPNDSGVLTAAVKLVVWDLDDTFWKGTLSEGPVEFDPVLAELVRTLNRRGIVNAICSKNDEGPVRAEPRRRDCGTSSCSHAWTGPRRDRGWPGSSRTPGSDPRTSCSSTTSRPTSPKPSTTRPGCRRPVRTSSTGCSTCPSSPGRTTVTCPVCTSTGSSNASSPTGRRPNGSHEEFLRSCAIHVAVHEDPLAELDRLHELSLRTNQLNFTKRRPDREEFAAELVDPDIVSGYIVVSDRYGDYGICGFYAIHRPSGVLTDFLFSCRVMGMGVEQWLYERLGRPDLEIVGDVASDLTGSVDWITPDDGSQAADGRESAAGGVDRPDRSGRTGRILIVGGCDLRTTADFLGGDIATEFAHPGDTGAFIHAGHTETFRQSVAGLSPEQEALVDRLPVVDRTTYRSAAVVDPDYDVLVLSVLTDYTQGLYRHRATGLLVPAATSRST